MKYRYFASVTNWALTTYPWEQWSRCCGMAVGTGGPGGLVPLLFRDVKKMSMVKMHLNDANLVLNLSFSEKNSGSLRSPFNSQKTI